MTTMFNRDVRCASCDAVSSQTLLGSTNTFGAPDLDLRPPPMKRETMNTWVQHCAKCGYCASDLSTRQGDLTLMLLADYQGVLKDERYPKLARYFLAQAMLNEGTLSSGWSRLRAAWCCDDAGQRDLAAECRRSASRVFLKFKAFEGEEAITRCAVTVDVLRRAGEFDQARALIAELEAVKLPEMVGQILRFQRSLADQQDVSCKKVSDVK